MSINVKVYDNGDHTFIVWLPADGKAIPACRGFAIRRLLNGKESYLHDSSDFPMKTSWILRRRGSFQCSGTCGPTMAYRLATWCSIRLFRS